VTGPVTDQHRVFDRPPRLAAAAALAVLGFVVVVLAGAGQGKLLTLESASARCPLRPLADPAIVERLVPLTSRCMWADGSATDLVPAWVNPALVVLAVILLLAIGLTVRAVVVSRRPWRSA
jgi:hypothetical protein